MGAFLGLIASLSWGVADYIGGIATRRTVATHVLVVSYPAGAIVLSAFVFLLPGRFSAEALLWGIIAALVGTVAIALLYLGLSRGPMGVVSPLTAVMSGAVPVTVGLLRGERLGLTGFAGILMAAVAVTLVSQQRGEHGQVRRSTLLIAIASGICIGLYLSALGLAPADSGIWAATIGRWASSLMIAFIVLVGTRNFRGRDFPWLLVVCCGVLDASANGIFQLAAQRGQLSVVAVIGSLYPAATALLARFLLHERLARIQLIGVVLAFVAAALLAAA